MKNRLSFCVEVNGLIFASGVCFWTVRSAPLIAAKFFKSHHMFRALKKTCGGK